MNLIAAGAATPPDWSQLWPDLIASVSTGLAVGLTVLVTELFLAGRRRARAASDAQRRAMAYTRELREPFDFAFISTRNGLLPDERAVQRARRGFDSVPPDKARPAVSGFGELDALLQAWDNLEASAGRIEKAMQQAPSSMRHPGDPEVTRAEDMETMRRWILQYDGGGALPFLVEGDRAWGERMSKDSTFMPLVKRYHQDRQHLEAAHREFVAGVSES